MRGVHDSARDRNGVIVGRLFPGADLIGGLESACDDHKLGSAVITFAYGSLSRSTFKTLQIPQGSTRAILMPVEIDERLEFLAGQGFICEDSAGRRDTHLHGCVSVQMESSEEVTSSGDRTLSTTRSTSP
jgi:predicted DNA-binding protein with PD1-like motif